MNEQRPTTQSVSLDDEAIIDVKAAGNFIGYLTRSLQRQRKVMRSTAIATFVVVAVLAVVLPRAYKIDTRILTHKTASLENFGGGGGAPPGADNPTAGAVELVKSRENMENLMTDVKLQEVWDAKRSTVSKLKDRVINLLAGPPSEADIHEAYLKMLDEKINATVEGEVVTMDVEWPDPDVAMSLSEGLVARFLKMRHDMELSEVVEAVNILERNVDNSRMGVEEVIKKMQKIFDEKEAELSARGAASAKSAQTAHKSKKSHFISIRKPVSAEQVDSGDTEARKSLNEKVAQFNNLKRSYDARLKKAQEELANLRATLGPDHPDYVDKKRELESLSQPPPELRALEQDISNMQAGLPASPAPAIPKTEYKIETTPAPQADNFDMVRVGVSDDLYAQLESDPEVTAILDELKKRQDAHDTLVQKLQNARIESEIKNVGFEYRYIMTEPPVYPKKPVKPNVPLMIGGGAVVSIILGALAALAKDVLSRRILEAWQLERFLNVKVFGEVDEP